MAGQRRLDYLGIEVDDALAGVVKPNAPDRRFDVSLGREAHI